MILPGLYPFAAGMNWENRSSQSFRNPRAFEEAGEPPTHPFAGEVDLLVRPLACVVDLAGEVLEPQEAGALGALDQQDLAGMLAVHVQAPSVLLNEFSPAMERGSRVVLIGSRTMTGVAGKRQYSATKSALAGLSRSWTIELADRAITCNVVAPGPTDTPMMVDPRRAGVPTKVPPLGALVEPRDVAALVGFLVGDPGKSITEQVLTVCGGASLRG